MQTKLKLFLMAHHSLTR